MMKLYLTGIVVDILEEKFSILNGSSCKKIIFSISDDKSYDYIRRSIKSQNIDIFYGPLVKSYENKYIMKSEKNLVYIKLDDNIYVEGKDGFSIDNIKNKKISVVCHMKSRQVVIKKDNIKIVYIIASELYEGFREYNFV